MSHDPKKHHFDQKGLKITKTRRAIVQRTMGTVIEHMLSQILTNWNTQKANRYHEYGQLDALKR
jgi:hypothetical protein